jgi:peptidoglycan/xylan/chitin deacetylase (PgdA/CDA1 family)
MRSFFLAAVLASLPVSTVAQASPDFPTRPEQPRAVNPAQPLPGKRAGAGLKLLEPHLHVAKSDTKAPPRVALTFDACMGEADERILSVLLQERIAATIFVTARWLQKNPGAVATFL